jgi:diguanylate cyclase (GGDEF)-like protein/PAS domain S-box-containing protein
MESMAIKSKTMGSVSRLRSRLQILIPSVVVLTGVALSAFYADLQQQKLSREAARNTVEEGLGLIRTKLEANINADVKLLQGMVAVIGAEPYVTQARFEALSSQLLSIPSQIRNVAAAPNLITSFVFPYEQNKSFIGKWILPPPGEEAVRQLREEGRTIFSGPLPLKDGSLGLIITLPVMMKNDDGDRVFWGGLAGIVDLDRLYDDSGLRAPDLSLSIAITDENQITGKSSVIYGEGHVLSADPVTMTVDLGNEKWEISAVPKGGWHAAGGPDLLIRGMIVAMSALIAGSVIWVGLLIWERQRNYAALRQREEQLTAVSHRLGLALEASRIGIWELDLASGKIAWDERMYQIYGVNREVAACYEVWKSRVHPEDLAASDEALAKAIEQDTLYETQFRIIRDGGEIRHIRTVGTISRDEDGRISVLGVNWDVSADISLQEDLREAQRKTEQQNAALEAARQRMEYNALHDALTGLPNRRYIDQKLAALPRDDQARQHLTVLHLDLDRFKEINDTLGHGAGDAILRHVADELASSVGPEDFVARIGGDEFVVVSTRAFGPDEPALLGERLITAISRPIIYDGHECRVGASVGIATQPDTAIPADQLLVNADIALYEAKRRGRNRVEPFNDHLRARTINTKHTADAILRSLGQEDFIAWFQPQFDARTLEINGVEALARWRHPQRGIFAPAAFLEIAESLNVVAQIDASILDQALAQLERWQAEGLGINHVSVNISAQRLFEDKLLDHMGKIAVKPGSLSFELLESISFDDKADAVAESLERIRSHGIAIEIDDFGTGYASILSLIKLSPTRLKIDRQLVAPIVSNPTQRRLISSIVDIGRSFGIGIVAEGVETMEHAAILRDLGCHTLQGYALARPMSPDSFIDFARAHALKHEDLWQRSA